MSEYVGIIEYTRGKGAETTKRLVSFEGKANSQKKARTLFSVAALDQAVAGEKVELLAISRLKKGRPVDKDLMKYQAAMTVILADNYNANVATVVKSLDKVLKDVKPLKKQDSGPELEWKDTKAGKGWLGLANNPVTPLKKTAPPLPKTFTALDMQALAGAGGVVKYDKHNQEVRSE